MSVPFSELIKSDIPLLVDFYADWCGPCKTMEPVIKDIADELHDKLKVIKINTDKNQQVSQAYGVQGIPTFILFHKGKILWRESGAMPKHHFLKTIQQYL